MEVPQYLKPLVIRRVIGASMAPKLRPGQLIIGTSVIRKLRPGQVVIVERDKKEFIKRIERIDENEHIFVIGDNLQVSTDSRHFGWLTKEDIVAKVLRPNLAK